jgi:hypothetical protein
VTCVGLEALGTLSVKSTVFWAVSYNFGGKYSFHLQGLKVSQARNKNDFKKKLELECCKNTERVTVAIAFWTLLREDLGSNLSRYTGYLNQGFSLFSSVLKMPG